jgi:hypothetical protein
VSERLRRPLLRGCEKIRVLKRMCEAKQNEGKSKVNKTEDLAGLKNPFRKKF